MEISRSELLLQRQNLRSDGIRSTRKKKKKITKKSDPVEDDSEVYNSPEEDEKNRNSEFLARIRQEIENSHQEQLDLYSTVCNDWHNKCMLAEAEINRLQQQLKESKTARGDLEAQLQETSTRYNILLKSFGTVQEKLRETNLQHEAETKEHVEKQKQLEGCLEKKEKEYRMKEDDLRNMLSVENARQKEVVATYERREEAFEATISQLQSDLEDLRDEIESGQEIQRSMKKDFEQKLREIEMEALSLEERLKTRTVARDALEKEKRELQDLLVQEQELRVVQKATYDKKESEYLNELRDLQQQLRESRQLCSQQKIQIDSEKDMRMRVESRNLALGEKCDSLKQHIEELQEQAMYDSTVRKEMNMELRTKDEVLRKKQSELLDTRKLLTTQENLREQAEAESIRQAERVQAMRRDRMSLLRSIEAPIEMQWD